MERLVTTIPTSSYSRLAKRAMKEGFTIAGYARYVLICHLNGEGMKLEYVEEDLPDFEA